VHSKPDSNLPQLRKLKKAMYCSGEMPSRRRRPKIEPSPRNMEQFWHSMIMRTLPASGESNGMG
jgi:hypothetical protein